MPSFRRAGYRMRSLDDPSQHAVASFRNTWDDTDKSGSRTRILSGLILPATGGMISFYCFNRSQQMTYRSRWGDQRCSSLQPSLSRCRQYCHSKAKRMGHRPVSSFLSEAEWPLTYKNDLKNC
jgi:hypothetical protein